jgi:hypothetical protein
MTPIVVSDAAMAKQPAMTAGKREGAVMKGFNAPRVRSIYRSRHPTRPSP